MCQRGNLEYSISHEPDGVRMIEVLVVAMAVSQLGLIWWVGVLQGRVDVQSDRVGLLLKIARLQADWDDEIEKVME